MGSQALVTAVIVLLMTWPVFGAEEGADLVLESITAGELCVGTANTIRVTVANPTATNVNEPIEVQLTVQAPANRPLDYLTRIASLAAGRRTELRFDRVAIPTAGEILMRVEIDPHRRLRELSTRNNTDTLNRTLTRDCAGGTAEPARHRLRVRVTDQRQRPVVGARVAAVDAGAAKALEPRTTDGGGLADFMFGKATRIAIEVVADDCARQKRQLLMPDRDTTVSIELACEAQERERAPAAPLAPNRRGGVQ